MFRSSRSVFSKATLLPPILMRHDRATRQSASRHKKIPIDAGIQRHICTKKPRISRASTCAFSCVFTAISQILPTRKTEKWDEDCVNAEPFQCHRKKQIRKEMISKKDFFFLSQINIPTVSLRHTAFDSKIKPDEMEHVQSLKFRVCMTASPLTKVLVCSKRGMGMFKMFHECLGHRAISDTK